MSTLVAPTDVSEGISLDQAMAFIWREAELLDRLKYVEWLGLWSEGGHYVVPIERSEVPFEERLNIAYDDREMREARVRRLRSGFSMSSAPPARTVRTVSRFVIADNTKAGLTLRCAQHILEYKYGRTRIIGADVTYRLVRENGALKLFDKIVQLVDSDGSFHGIGYLL